MMFVVVSIVVFSPYSNFAVLQYSIHTAFRICQIELTKPRGSVNIVTIWITNSVIHIVTILVIHLFTTSILTTLSALILMTAVALRHVDKLFKTLTRHCTRHNQCSLSVLLAHCLYLSVLTTFFQHIPLYTIVSWVQLFKEIYSRFSLNRQTTFFSLLFACFIQERILLIDCFKHCNTQSINALKTSIRFI